MEIVFSAKRRTTRWDSAFPSASATASSRGSRARTKGACVILSQPTCAINPPIPRAIRNSKRSGPRKGRILRPQSDFPFPTCQFFFHHGDTGREKNRSAGVSPAFEPRQLLLGQQDLCRLEAGATFFLTTTEDTEIHTAGVGDLLNLCCLPFEAGSKTEAIITAMK